VSYSYISKLPNGKTNGVALFETLANTLGKDFTTWEKNPLFKSTLQFCHTNIFGETGSFRPGLKLRTLFLIRAPKQDKSTKNHPCYNDALIEALVAGVIDIVQYRLYSK
jgi:hypothetical protein